MLNDYDTLGRCGVNEVERPGCTSLRRRPQVKVTRVTYISSCSASFACYCSRLHLVFRAFVQKVLSLVAESRITAVSSSSRMFQIKHRDNSMVEDTTPGFLVVFELDSG